MNPAVGKTFSHDPGLSSSGGRKLEISEAGLVEIFRKHRRNIAGFLSLLLVIMRFRKFSLQLVYNPGLCFFKASFQLVPGEAVGQNPQQRSIRDVPFC